MKKELHVILIDNVNKQEFASDHNIELINDLNAIPSMIIANIEESYIETLRSDSRVFHIEEQNFNAIPASILPSFYTQSNKTITGILPSTSNNGSNYIPLQFYLNTDQIVSSQTLGVTDADAIKSLPNVNYSSRWTGKNVDIVALEVGPINASNLGLHYTHPDYLSIDLDNKIIPMNWSGLTSSDNNQVASNSMLSDHARGVLSASAGTICGFAKRSTYRICYLNATDNVVSCLNSIISWHNSKPVNPQTGFKNPTLMISEYQFVYDRFLGVKVDSIQSITTPSGTVNRPGASWGSDLTPFVSRNIIPWKLLDPITNTYHWSIVFPFQLRYGSLQTALEQAWDAGITVVTGAGNNGAVYVKTSDPEFLGTYCTVTSGADLYSLRNDTVNYTVSINKFTLASTTTYRPFCSYGPNGLDKGIDVAASQNSEVYPVLDPYSNRGPGIDISGLGSNTWTSYVGDRYVNGTWGMFSGTSCAAPTVAGICACIMERYFTYNNVWPTPDQVKKILLSEAKSVLKSVDATTWNNVPAASTDYAVTAYSPSLNTIFNFVRNGLSLNGGLRISELLGTTLKRVFFNSQSFNRSQTQSKRPTTGKVYPRPRIRRTGT